MDTFYCTVMKLGSTWTSASVAAQPEQQIKANIFIWQCSWTLHMVTSLVTPLCSIAKKLQRKSFHIAAWSALLTVPTNMEVCWLQQELYFLQQWCVAAHMKPIGLVQRCLFSFRRQLPAPDPTWDPFWKEAFIPFLEHIFRFVLPSVGPKAWGRVVYRPTTCVHRLSDSKAGCCTTA